jgi:biopolymer transport protein ExbB/TolQ
MERRLRVLAWLASAGPFVGLIGTVAGIHAAFAIETRTPADVVRAGLGTSVLVVLISNVILGVAVLMCRPWKKP